MTKLTVVEKLALIAVLRYEEQLQKDFLRIAEEKEAVAQAIEQRLGLEEGTLAENYRINTDTWEVEQIKDIEVSANGKPSAPVENPSNKSSGKKKL